MQAPSIYGTYSRLIIDPNRSLDHPQCILYESDGINIPANHDLSAAQRQARIDGIHKPYDMKPYTGVSLDTHARARQMPHVLVEIRQDLIGDAQEQAKWAEIMRVALTEFAPTTPSSFPARPQPARPIPPSP